MEKGIRVFLGCVYGLFSVLTVAQPVQAEATASQTAIESKMVTVDAVLDEWRAMEVLESKDNDIAEWKIAKSEDGKTLYLCYTGTVSTVWDSMYSYKVLQITYANGTNYSCAAGYLAEYWSAPGAEVVMKNGASGTNPGPYVVECAMPIDAEDYSITFAGTTIKEKDIPVFVPAEEVEAVYEGITIDGKYGDWDAVNKVEAECPPEAYHDFDCLDYAACVMDGDYLYIYLQDGESGHAAGAGLHSNGRYSITSDLGRRVVFQLSTKDGGSVDGIDGAEVAYYGKQWEIAIPVSELPIYSKSVDFGLYQQEPFVAEIVNLQGTEGSAGDFDGIVYDGMFGDWTAYPHTLIQYATSGTQTNGPDGEGALYVEDGTLFGHVISTMDAHLAEEGGEFAKAISICFNGDREYNGDKTWNYYPRLVMVEEDGTINWSPQTADLPNGTYEFYISDARAEFDTTLVTNISQLQEHEKFVGKMWVEVGESNDEIEFYMDLEQVAKYLSYYSTTTITADDFKLIEAQFGRIGQDYLSIGATSSGPYVGVALCAGVAAIILLRRKRKNKVVVG